MPGRKRKVGDSADSVTPSDDEQAYAAWLRSKGVWWREDAVAIGSENVVAGWGVVATANIKKGELLFTVPWQACLGARSKKVDAGPPEGDTQAHLAGCLLREQAKGGQSSWSPLLRMLTRAPCPWVWPKDATSYLTGTELEPVLKVKSRRLASEHSASKELQRYSAAEYAEACALAVSHINPWFGGSVVPFNTTLNWSAQPNVEFDAAASFSASSRSSGRSSVAGRATRDISIGEELTQECAPSTAELLYRYGFSPSEAELPRIATAVPAAAQAERPAGIALADDAVSIQFDALVTACGGCQGGGNELKRRLQLLCYAGALDDSPWDGLEGVVTVELQWSGGGVAKLLGACLVLSAGEAQLAGAEKAAMEAAPKAFADDEEGEGGDASCALHETKEKGGGSDDDDGEEEEDEDEGGEEEEENEDDLVAAAVVAALSGASGSEAQALTKLAVEEGGEDGDPWPSLLERAPLSEATADRVRAAARRAVEARLHALTAAPFPTAPPPPTTTTTSEFAALCDAWRAAMGLRRAEEAILKAALEDVEAWRRGAGGSLGADEDATDTRANTKPEAPSRPPPPSAPPSPAAASDTVSEGDTTHILPDDLPDGFGRMASEMPKPLRALIVDNADPETVDAAELASALSFLPLEMPMGCSDDVISHKGLIDDDGCAALRAAVDAKRGTVVDTVDGAADHQLNLTTEELALHIGKAQLEAVRSVARSLDVQTGGSGQRELPIVEAFVRRYTAGSRPWHPFHQDRAFVTVNVALSDDSEHEGGRLVGLFGDGAVVFERSAGSATVHLSRIVHGVTRMQSGVRYSLIVFLGHEPAVRRQIVRERGADGEIVERWTRAIVGE